MLWRAVFLGVFGLVVCVERCHADDSRLLQTLQVVTAGNPLESADQVFIWLHGYGAAGDDLDYLAVRLDLGDKVTHLFPQGPIALEQGGFAWSAGGKDELEQSRQRVARLVRDVQTKNPKCRVSVGGFSQGAALALSMLAVTDLMLENLILYSPGQRIEALPRAGDSSPRIFLAHGTHDAVVSIENSHRCRGELVERGYDVTWYPFEGPHHVTGEEIGATQKFLSGPKADFSGTPP